MKKILFLMVLSTVFISCKEDERMPAQKKQTDVTRVLYFHGKQRCITCNAIENLTKEVIDSLANGKVLMEIIDISKKENESIVDKYEVSWSSLILDRNGEVGNLTEMAFSYAKGQPKIFKEKLVEAIHNMKE